MRKVLFVIMFLFCTVSLASNDFMEVLVQRLEENGCEITVSPTDIDEDFYSVEHPMVPRNVVFGYLLEREILLLYAKPSDIDNWNDYLMFCLTVAGFDADFVKMVIRYPFNSCVSVRYNGWRFDVEKTLADTRILLLLYVT